MDDTTTPTRADGAEHPSPEGAANRAGLPTVPPMVSRPVAVPDGSPNTDGEQVASPPSQPVTQPTWDVDANPFRYVAMQQQAELANLRAQTVQQQLAGEVADLREQGASEEQIATHLNLRQREVQLAAVNSQIQSISRVEVARQLALRLQQAGISVTQEELLKDSSGREIASPDAMMTRAQTLFEERRKVTNTERKQAGVDRVGADNPRPVVDGDALKRMTPTQKIAYGLRKSRGQV